MANVNKKFNNKDYLLSCDDGQEENLVELANHLDSKYTELKKELGNIGESKLLLITSITIMDEYYETKKKIDQLVEKNKVCLFMKGTPEVPQCGFSLAVANVLKHLKIDFHGVNVLEDDELRQGIKQYSDWPTIPQLYINQKFVGGCDIVKEMFETGELQTKLKE